MAKVNEKRDATEKNAKQKQVERKAIIRASLKVNKIVIRKIMNNSKEILGNSHAFGTTWGHPVPKTALCHFL